MDVRLTKAPLRALARMQPKTASRIEAALGSIAAEPGERRANLKPLRNVPNGFRLRVGDWRVSFVVDREAGVLTVFEIEPRGGAYRW